MNTFAQFLPLFRRTLTLVALVLGLLISSRASAAVFTWSGGGANASWSTTANWSNGSAPTTGNDLLFNNSTRTSPNVNNIGSLSIGTLTFGNSANPFTITGSALNLGSINNTSSFVQTLNLAVSHSTSGTYNASSNITLSSTFSGSGDIVKTGAGTLALNGVSKSGYTGTITVSNGTLSIGTAAANTANLQNGRVVLQDNTTLATGNGGNLTLSSLEISGTNVTLPSNTLAFVGGGLTNSTGSQLTVANNVSFAGTTTIDAGPQGMVLSGLVGGSGTTSSIGSGLLDLTNVANGFVGSFIVSSGTTRLSTGMATADFTVGNGATLESTAGGAGAVSRLTLQNGATLLPGSPDSIGSITVTTDLAMSSASNVKFDIAGYSSSSAGAGGTDFDQVNFAANLTSGLLTYDGYLDLNFSSGIRFDNGLSFQLFNDNSAGTFAGNLLGIHNTTTTAGSPYDNLSFVSFDNISDPAEKAFLASYFGLSSGDWISSWNTDHQRLIFSQSTGTLTVVPEPSTIVFAGIGMAMFGWSTWTRRRAKVRQQFIEASIA